MLVEHGSGAAGLVGIDPDDHTHPATSLVDPILSQGGQPDLEQCSPLLSHSLVGCRRDRRPFWSQPMAAGGYAERPAGTLRTLRLQTTGLLSGIQQVGGSA